MKNKYNIQMLVVDFLIAIAIFLISCIAIKDPIITNKVINTNMYVGAIVIPVFIISLFALIFGLYIEYKFNKLKFKNIFLLLGIIIAINNLMMAITIPSSVIVATYNGVSYTMNITIYQRIYSIVIGCSIGLSPFIFTYVIPRAFLVKKNLLKFLYIFLFVITVITLISFFTDSSSYMNIIKSGFTDYSKPVKGILQSKFTFALFLFIGVICGTFLHMLTKNWKWLIFSICFCLISIFTFAKLQTLLSFIYLIIYLFVLLFPIINKNKDNRIIFILIAIFIVINTIVFSIFIANSQYGVFYKIRQAFDNIAKSARETFSTRTTIWQSAFNTLKPYQYVFGYGFFIGDIAMNISYTHNPLLVEDPTNIMHCHSAYIESIQTGGVLYLLINLLLIVLLGYYSKKLFRYNKNISIMSFVILASILACGITDSFILFSDSQYAVFTAFYVITIMSLYYLNIDKDEEKRREDIVDNADAIKKINYKNKLLNLNKKIIIYNAKLIKNKKELL